MIRLRIYDDPAECRTIWERCWPQRSLFDLWQARECFATGYNRQPHFLVAEEGKTIKGLLALSWVEEEEAFMHFPGETWKGKTWLEQNRIPASSTQVLQELMSCAPRPAYLRYLVSDSVPIGEEPVAVDEVGYLFFPGKHGYSFQSYFQLFSKKSQKKLTKELDGLAKQGVAYRYNQLNDIDWIYKTNIENFQQDSYFHDSRFLNSVEKLVAWLHQQGSLRVTTLLIGGSIAAVDIGVVWNKTYTLLAGATNPLFPGVAKMINFHHLEWACRNRVNEVDFLCGDFGWKQRFHLSPRPLYELHMPDNILCSNNETFHEYACRI